MTIPRSHLALLFAVPPQIRTRGRVVLPTSVTWGKHFPELQFMGDIEGHSFSDIPPGVERWQRMMQWIYDHATSLDGVIIVHERERLLPGAVLLDLACHRLPVPIVITMPSRNSVHDWRTNVVVALQAAIVGVPGPVVIDGDRIVRAGTVRWESPEVITGATAARLDFGVRNIVSQSRSEKLPKKHRLDTSMMIIDIRSGLSAPSIPSTPTDILLRVHEGAAWKTMERWAKRLPVGSRVLVQTSLSRLPGPFRQWGIVPTSEDDVAVVQAAWIFGQGNGWKKAIKTTIERRRL